MTSRTEYRIQNTTNIKPLRPRFSQWPSRFGAGLPLADFRLPASEPLLAPPPPPGDDERDLDLEPEPDLEPDLDLDLLTGDRDLLDPAESSSESLSAFLACSSLRAFLASMSLSSSSSEEYACFFSPRLPLFFLYLFLIAAREMAPSPSSLSPPSKYPELSRLLPALSFTRFTFESRLKSDLSL